MLRLWLQAVATKDYKRELVWTVWISTLYRLLYYFLTIFRAGLSHRQSRPWSIAPCLLRCKFVKHEPAWRTGGVLSLVPMVYQRACNPLSWLYCFNQLQIVRHTMHPTHHSVSWTWLSEDVKSATYHKMEESEDDKDGNDRRVLEAVNVTEDRSENIDAE